MSKVPEKFLKLSAAFRELRSQLSIFGFHTITDVEGCLSGTGQVALLREIVFFSPSFAKFLLEQEGVSSAASDAKLVAAVFRIAPTTPISSSQFVTVGGFAVKKIEFLTAFVRMLVAKHFVKSEEDSSSSEEEPGELAATLADLSASITALNDRVSDAFETLQCRFENLEARLIIVESRQSSISR